MEVRLDEGERDREELRRYSYHADTGTDADRNPVPPLEQR